MKAPEELKRYEGDRMMASAFPDAIEDAVIFQVHIWIKRELAKNPPADAYWILHKLEEWLPKPDGYEELDDMV